MTKIETTVRDAIYNELDPENVHAINVTKATDSAIYLVVVSERPVGDVSDIDGEWDVVDQRTVIYDRDTNSVIETDNGMWTPATAANLDNLTKAVARATSYVGADTDERPLEQSAAESVDPELLLNRTVEEADGGQNKDRIQRAPGIDSHRSWGYGSSPPPEAYEMAEILREAGLDPTDHLIRCDWGKKKPNGDERSGKGEDDGDIGRPVEELCGNYGIEVRRRQSGLVALDADHPEKLPDMIEELPETVKISSPHGTEERCHRLYYCENKQEVAKHATSAYDGDNLNWQLMYPWGELWVGEPFVVGVGSQLSEYACDKQGHSKGDEGGCSACSDPDGGYYEFVGETREIAEVSPDQLNQLIDETSVDSVDVSEADRAENVDQDVSDDVEITEDTETVECGSCGAVIPESTARINTIAGNEVITCKGGCQ